ncbi:MULTISPECIES: hypothetical protein [unclassified Bacillus (in: firmicutes)]|uniref:hypothetical protein n=1 Tax=unclassified Bacillus (in: firmicutes) TaxID=185979 RepID=UPI000BFBD966|nr:MULTISPECIES: hypothetical protein [unclassified Bacillus (in: firmicutes)]PGM54182.1 hypothetical protein CN946_16405 [Bacillus sp. AFS053548]PGZ90477.1 hypothetical protein COE53_18075 [Bacillus sp. AFS029533]
MKKHEIHELSIGSIRYVYDERAATKWFDLYVELAKEMLITNASKKDGQTYIEYERSEKNNEKDSSLLS